MATRMQQRRGTAAQWTSANPILAAGEIGFETDTGQFKIGNGSSAWSSLSYFKDTTDGASSFAPLVNGLIPLAYMANLVDGSNANLDTLKELADYADAIETSVETHANQSTGVHGIANTANLATIAQLTSHSDDTTNIHGITNTADLVTATQLSNHANLTTGVHGIVDTAELATKAYADNAAGAVATGATNSLNAAITSEVSNRNTAIAAAITDHNSDTSSVHGIADTTALATKTYADGKASDAQTAAQTFATGAVSTHNSDETNVHGIADTTALATKTYADGAVSTHNTDTTQVHGIADTTALATKNYADTAVSTAMTSHEADTTSVHGIADTSLLVTTTGTQTLTNKTLTSPTINGATVGGNIVPSVDNTYDLGSPTNMWKDIYVGPGSLYVNGQKVLQDDSGNIVVSADPDENLALRTSGSGNVELDPTGTGNIQVKGPLSIQSGSQITSSDGNAIVFGNSVNVDTISSKTTNTDLSLSGNGTGKVYVNDNAEVNGNLVVGGNLTVSGTTTTVNSETISLADNLIDLNSNFTTGTPTENAGIKVKRGDSSDVQIRWNESTDVWEFTNDGATYSTIAPLNNPTLTAAIDSKLDSATAATTYAPIASPTFTGTVTLPAAGIVFSDGTQSKEGVPSKTSIIQKTAAYTLSALSERDSMIEVSHTGGSAVDIMIPTNSSVAYPVGTSIDVLRTNTGKVRIVGAAGVTVNATPGAFLRDQWSAVTLFKRATDTWVLIGDLATA